MTRALASRNAFGPVASTAVAGSTAVHTIVALQPVSIETTAPEASQPILTVIGQVSQGGGSGASTGQTQSPQKLQSARVGDPTSHGGKVLNGSLNVFVNGKALALVGISMVSCPIHGTNPIVKGSNANVLTNGKQRAMVGAISACGSRITSGSSDTING